MTSERDLHVQLLVWSIRYNTQEWYFGNPYSELKTMFVCRGRIAIVRHTCIDIAWKIIKVEYVTSDIQKYHSAFFVMKELSGSRLSDNK
jgi:hypothetical protein